MLLGDSTPTSTKLDLGLVLSHKPEDWNTPTRKRSGAPGKPLEQMIYDISLEALESAVRDHTFLIDDGEKEARYIRQLYPVS